jgi:UDP-N-acetyl-D-galactosamine dehydrogenase
MADYVAKKTVQLLIKNDKSPKQAKLLIMGVTFKENVADIRNSKVADVVNALKEYMVNVDITDIHADSDEVHHEYGFKLTENIGNEYDAVIVAVAHDEYKQLSADYFRSIMKENPILIDLKNLYGNFNNSEIERWSL